MKRSHFYLHATVSFPTMFPNIVQGTVGSLKKCNLTSTVHWLTLYHMAIKYACQNLRNYNADDDLPVVKII